MEIAFLVGARKNFFCEEKKQKTFGSLSRFYRRSLGC
jgi:hypothetical protein